MDLTLLNVESERDVYDGFVSRWSSFSSFGFGGRGLYIINFD